MDIATFKCAILSMSIGKGKKKRKEMSQLPNLEAGKKSNKMIPKKVGESK